MGQEVGTLDCRAWVGHPTLLRSREVPDLLGFLGRSQGKGAQDTCQVHLFLVR